MPDMRDSARRLVILAEGALDFHFGKTAISLLRYRPGEVVAVVDRQNAGRTCEEVLGIGGDIPIVSHVREAMSLEPTALLIGIAPRGGGLPREFRSQILFAINHGLDVISGLHFMFAEDPEFSAAADARGVHLVDVRKPPEDLSVSKLSPRPHGSRVITFVGSDCAVGKMTAALECVAEARRQGMNTAFVATGQTGIMLEGSGIAVDRVIGDFIAGAAERLVLDATRHASWIFVEGQGSLLHPAYSGVTLALLHGSSPDAMILVDQVDHRTIDEYDVRIPPIERLVEIYQEAAGWIKPARVEAIALNTRAVSEIRARNAIAQAEQRTGLVTDDPVRFGAHRIIEAIRDNVPSGRSIHVGR